MFLRVGSRGHRPHAARSFHPLAPPTVAWAYPSLGVRNIFLRCVCTPAPCTVSRLSCRPVQRGGGAFASRAGDVHVSHAPCPPCPRAQRCVPAARLILGKGEGGECCEARGRAGEARGGEGWGRRGHGRAGAGGAQRRSRHARLVFVPPSSICFVTGEMVAPSSGECSSGCIARKPPRVAVSTRTGRRVAARLARVVACVLGGGRVPGRPPSPVPLCSLPFTCSPCRASRQMDTLGVPLVPGRALRVDDTFPWSPPACLWGTFRMKPVHSPHAVSERVSSGGHLRPALRPRRRLCSGRCSF